MGDGNFGEGGGISLGASTPANGPAKSNADIMAQFSQPVQSAQAAPSSSLLFSSPPQIQQPQFSHPQPPVSQTPQPTQDFFSSPPAPVLGTQTSSKPTTPLPQYTPQPPPSKKVDPFASLSTATPPRQASPAPTNFQHSIPQSSKSPAVPIGSKPAPSDVEQTSTMDLLGMGNGTSSTSRPSTADASAKKEDDEWTFSSALPDQPTELVVTNSSIRTVFNVNRVNDTNLELKSRISNSTDQSITDLTFQLAVTKVSMIPPLSHT